MCVPPFTGTRRGAFARQEMAGEIPSRCAGNSRPLEEEVFYIALCRVSDNEVLRQSCGACGNEEIHRTGTAHGRRRSTAMTRSCPSRATSCTTSRTKRLRAAGGRSASERPVARMSERRFTGRFARRRACVRHGSRCLGKHRRHWSCGRRRSGTAIGAGHQTPWRKRCFPLRDDSSEVAGGKQPDGCQSAMGAVALQSSAGARVRSETQRRAPKAGP